MKKHCLYRLAGVIVFAVLIWAFCYLKALNPLSALRSHSDATPSLAIQLKEAKLVGWSQGKRVWKLQSKFINVSKDRVHVTFDGGLHGEMLRDEKKIGDVKAEKVIYNIYSNDLFIPGTAEVKLKNGPSIKALSIYWNAKTMHLASNGGVDAALDVGSVHGKKLSMDLGNKEITIQKANGSIKVE